MSKHAFALAAVLTIALAPGQAFADDPIDRQFAPFGTATTGDHGTVGATGAYATQVPLDLPAPRGDVSVPVSVVYQGGARVGAAGVGWDVPILGVTRRSNVSRNKPRYGNLDEEPALTGINTTTEALARIVADRRNHVDRIGAIRAFYHEHRDHQRLRCGKIQSERLARPDRGIFRVPDLRAQIESLARVRRSGGRHPRVAEAIRRRHRHSCMR